MSSTEEKTLPEGWINKELGDICDVIGGGTPKTKVSEYWDGEVVWLSPIDLPPIGEISFVSDSRKKITDLGLQKSSAKLLPKGSVVYSTRASIGKIAIAEVPLSTNQGFTNFICNEQISNYFLCYALKHFNKNIEELSNSTTFKEVSKTAIKSFKIPLPPLEEQKRIVAKIDGLFAKIDKAISLTEESLKQAKNLLPSVLKEVFEKGKADGWEERKWEDVLEIKNGKSQKEFLVNEGGFPIYGSGGVMNGRVSKSLCPKNTTIIGRKGTIDKPKYIEEEFWNVDTAFGLCSNIDLSPRFLYYFCLTFNFWTLNKSTTLPSLTKRDLLQIRMPFTSSENQMKVVKIADDVLLKSKQTQSKLEEQLAYLQQLKSSILSKAFKGEL